jgi:Cytochrome c554 and c-prime
MKSEYPQTQRQLRGIEALAGIILCAVAAPVAAYSENPCAVCHPKEVAGFAATQMGHSLGLPTPVPAGKFFHAPSNSEFSIKFDKAGMIQTMARDGQTVEYRPAFEVGSGTHAYAYLVLLNGCLFESPLGYFPGHGWAMSPGFEKARHPDFDRPVTPDCLVCHSGKALSVKGTFNTYQSPAFAEEAISCERCHGPTAAHLKKPVPGSIINPAHLPERARDSVCEQCHLNGEERIANPGKQISDFQAGENLEDVFSVYVAEGSTDPATASPFKVVSQVQQVTLSTCWRQSKGRMWCGTCHDPHYQPSNPQAYFRAKCLSCHGAELVQTHPKPNEDCIGCHMPRRPVSDGAHTIFTDHHISRRPAPEMQSPGWTPPTALVAWYAPQGPLARRNLGLAEIKVGERAESVSLLNQGLQNLLASWDAYPDDPPILRALGEVATDAGKAQAALPVLEHAIKVEPENPWNYVHAAHTSHIAHDDPKAIMYLEKALTLDPNLQEAYQDLAAIYGDINDQSQEAQTFERYLKAFPQSLEARTSLQAIRRIATR